jgi:hypothetical protein
MFIFLCKEYVMRGSLSFPDSADGHASCILMEASSILKTDVRSNADRHPGRVLDVVKAEDVTREIETRTHLRE